MSADAETVMEGLKDFLKQQLDSNLFKAISRTVPFWDRQAEQPFLGIRLIGQDDVWSGEGLVQTTLDVELWIYARTEERDDDTPNERMLNDLVTAVRQVVAPPDIEEFQTLNGLVYRARLEGRSIYNPGDIGNQATATISLKLLLPSYP